MSVAVASAIGATHAVPIDVANACAGTLTGVFVANNWVRRGAARNALVVSGEYISQLGRNAAGHVHTIASRELASLTLGDAGGAALVERAEHGEAGITFAGFTTISEHSRLCLAYPARHDPGHRMFTKSRALQDAAIADLPGVLREALDSSSLEIGDRPGDLDPDPSRCAAGHANISMYGDYYGIVNADTLVGADGRQWTRSKPAAPTLPTRT